MRIGVLAIQGSFILHIQSLQRLGVETIEVRNREQLDEIDGLIMPGGESTTFGILFDKYNLGDSISKLVTDGLPVWGTCAGAIMLGRGTERPQPRLNLIDIDVIRNAYGRQVDSFVTPIQIKGMDTGFQGVFIRAPKFFNPGLDVEILSDLNGEPIMARQANVLISSFHPELTPDSRVHQYFVNELCRPQGIGNGDAKPQSRVAS